LRRKTFKVLGFLSLAAGAVGIVLPVLPSTIFFILAAGCFARSSPQLEKRILDHPTIGPPVIAWRTHGAIPVQAKIYALCGMAAGFAIFYWSLSPRPLLAALVGGSITACAVFVLTRPSGPQAQLPEPEAPSADKAAEERS